MDIITYDLVVIVDSSQFWRRYLFSWSHWVEEWYTEVSNEELKVALILLVALI